MRYQIYGKEFDLPPVSKKFQVVLHEDYPLIEKQDIDKFLNYANGRGTFVISGCKARVHPYRLMYIEETGFDNFVVDIPQSVRGNRHYYPKIYQIIPALIAIPPNTRINSIYHEENIDLFVMPEDKLLDKYILNDDLLIKAINKMRTGS